MDFENLPCVWDRAKCFQYMSLFYYHNNSVKYVVFHSCVQKKTGRNFWMIKELCQVVHTPLSQKEVILQRLARTETPVC